jgi:aminopeptidase
MFEYLADGVAKSYYETATPQQLSFFPSQFLKGKIDEMTHIISIIAEADKYELQGIDPKKLTLKRQSRKPYIQWQTQKELEGKLTRTVAMYGTPAMAKDAGMTTEAYWQQIIQACYLDQEHPIQQRQKTQTEIETIRRKLNDIYIDKIHMEGADMDLWITIGENRQRLGGGGRNIPSFEVFTSPDRRETQGWIQFNQPLFRYGQKIDGIKLVFNQGVVQEFDAKEGKELLTEIFQIPGTKSIGEFSLTDARHSRITKFMGETLYDENMGGKYGNTHLAIGRSYEDTSTVDLSPLTEEERKQR